MPFWSVPDREPLLRPAIFIVLAVLIVIGMLAVFPDRQTFMDSAVEGEPDDVSVAYLKLLLQSGEGDPEMLMTFAQQLRLRNRLEDAKDVLRAVRARSPGRRRGVDNDRRTRSAVLPLECDPKERRSHRGDSGRIRGDRHGRHLHVDVVAQTGVGELEGGRDRARAR